jgi:hypothetical protein
MSKFLLVLHVLAVVIALGPVTVASSMFPQALRRAQASPGDAGARAALGLLNRICRVYAVVAIAVPVFGFGLASTTHVLGKTWMMISIVLTVVAAAVLIFLLPAQQRALDEVDGVAAPAAEGALAAAVAGPAAETPATTGAGTAVAAPAAVSTASPARLAMFAGLFNLLWAVVAVLMIVRP